MWTWITAAALAGADVRAQVVLDGDHYSVNASEYVWCSMALHVTDAQGVVLAHVEAKPRMEVGCSQEGTRPGALASYRAWYAGGGWDVDLVRRGATLALVRTPVELDGPTGPPEVYLAVALPEDASLALLPTSEPVYAWFDATATAAGVELALRTGDPPARVDGVAVAKVGCQPLATWDDPDAKAAFRCADGLVYARWRGRGTAALVDGRGATLASFAVPSNVRTDW